MNTVSMRLPNEMLREVDKRAAELDIPRTEYIRRAILAMNRALDDSKRRDRLNRASLKVRAESMLDELWLASFAAERPSR